MKKKTMSKLSLSKTTVTNLQTTVQVELKGGYAPTTSVGICASILTSCFQTCNNQQNSCYLGCTDGCTANTCASNAPVCCA